MGLYERQKGTDIFLSGSSKEFFCDLGFPKEPRPSPRIDGELGTWTPSSAD